MTKKTEKPAPPPPPVRPFKGDPLARALARNVRDAHGVGQGITLDLAEGLAAPRGYVGTRNVALDRALGAPGIPLSRVTEISGWPGAGKSTMADQILAQCQAEGGLAVLADTERNRNIGYMRALGVDPASCVWLGGRTIEAMFEQLETLLRSMLHANAMAWHDALIRAGLKPPALAVKRYEVFDPDIKRTPRTKPQQVFQFQAWTRGHVACLMEWQRSQGLLASGVRDDASAAILQPLVVAPPDELADPDNGDVRAEALRRADQGDVSWVQPADRKVVVVWDSVAGTPTEEELEDEIRDQHPATAAKVIKRALRRQVQILGDEKVALVLVNQRYEKIRMGADRYKKDRGPDTRTYGGGGIEYHTAVRVEVEKVGVITPPGARDGDYTPPMGQVVQITVEKNKVNSPYQVETCGLIYGRGADNAWALYEDLYRRGIIRVGGGWSRFTDSSILGAADRSFRGWTDLSNMLAEDDGGTLWERLHALYQEGRR